MSVDELAAGDAETWLRGALSRTVLGFHGALTAVVCVAIFVG